MPWATDIIDDHIDIYGYELTSSERVEIMHNVHGDKWALYVALSQLLPLMKYRIDCTNDICDVFKEMIVINLFGGGGGLMMTILNEVRYTITSILDQLLATEYDANDKGMLTERGQSIAKIRDDIISCNIPIENILSIYYIKDFDSLEDQIDEWGIKTKSSLMLWWHPEDSIVSLKEMWHLEDIFTSSNFRHLSQRIIIVRKRALVFNNALITSLIIQLENNEKSSVYGRGRFCTM